MGDKLFIEGGGSYVNFVKSEREMILGIDGETLEESQTAFYLTYAST